MLTMDAWHRIFPEPEAEGEVGATKGDRTIDQELLPPCVSEHVQSVFTTPTGRIERQAVLLRLGLQNTRLDKRVLGYAARFSLVFWGLAQCNGREDIMG